MHFSEFSTIFLRKGRSNMGFYQQDREKNGKGVAIGKWAAVVVLSACVGSAATMLIMPKILNQWSSGQSISAFAPSSNDVSSVAKNVNVSVTDGITKVVKQVEPDVVAVVNYASVSNPFSQQSEMQAQDIGSGVYFEKQGNTAYIVTNNHVVQGGSEVKLVMSSGKHIQGTVVGTDEFTDLAVIKVPASDFQNIQPATFANSSLIQVGEPAIAIGTPMGLDFADTVTSGIISGLNRVMPVEEPNTQQTLDYQPVIQTDAAINPGNSGGPLLNMAGQVMGINSSKIVATGFQGMGFAIPSNEVRQITQEIIQTGHATHPALGIDAISLPNIPQEFWPNVPVDYGVYVQSVISSQAKQSGVERGDVIVAINGQTVKSDADLRTDLFSLHPNQVITVTVYRGQKKLNLKWRLGTLASPNTTQSANANTNSSSSQTVDPFATNPFAGSSGFNSYGD